MTGRPPFPDFGDGLGLYSLVRWAKGRVRARAQAPVGRAAILAEIERQCRAALQTEGAERQCGEKPTEGRRSASISLSAVGEPTGLNDPASRAAPPQASNRRFGVGSLYISPAARAVHDI